MDLLKVKEMVAVLHFICVPEQFALFVICIYSSFRSPGFLFFEEDRSDGRGRDFC